VLVLNTQLTFLSQLEDGQSSVGDSSLGSIVPATVPTALQCSSDFASNVTDPGGFIPPSSNRFDYSWVAWQDSHLIGWTKLLSSEDLTAWWWSEGVPVYSYGDKRRAFVYRPCFTRSRQMRRLLCDSSSNAIIRHLARAHSIAAPAKKRPHDNTDSLGLDLSQPRDQLLLNSLADSFNAEQFKQLLIQ